MEETFADRSERMCNWMKETGRLCRHDAEKACCGSVDQGSKCLRSASAMAMLVVLFPDQLESAFNDLRNKGRDGVSRTQVNGGHEDESSAICVLLYTDDYELRMFAKRKGPMWMQYESDERSHIQHAYRHLLTTGKMIWGPAEVADWWEGRRNKNKKRTRKPLPNQSGMQG